MLGCENDRDRNITLENYIQYIAHKSRKKQVMNKINNLVSASWLQLKLFLACHLQHQYIFHCKRFVIRSVVVQFNFNA